jgi:hypothetical protein
MVVLARHLLLQVLRLHTQVVAMAWVKMLLHLLNQLQMVLREQVRLMLVAVELAIPLDALAR